MGNLPLRVLVGVHVSVSGLDFISGGAHGEFVDSSIHAPVFSLDDIGLQDDALWLLCQEVDEVRLDSGVVGARKIGDSREKDRGRCVSLSNRVRVQSSQGVVP